MFDNRMLEERKKLGLTQKQVAEKAGVRPASYSAYENNKMMPPLDIALRIADALDVSIESLCGVDKSCDLETYGDVARLLVNLSMQPIDVKLIVDATPWQNAKLSSEKKIRYEAIEKLLETSAKNNSASQMAYEIKINIQEDILGEFFESFCKLLNLYKAGTIEKDMLDAWLDKKTKFLSKIPLVPNKTE